MTRYDVRRARPDDLPYLYDIEDAADQLFYTVFTDLSWDPPASGEARAAEPGFVLVAGEPPVGFAHVLRLGEGLHLEQLAVRPDHGRRGIGSALVEAVCDEVAAAGCDEVTLMTYADVPWNAPYYRRLGFEELTELPPALVPLRLKEQQLGLERWGRRTAMRRRLC